MNPAPWSALSSLEDAATLSPQNVLDLAAAWREWETTGAVLRQEIAGLRQQIDWFKRQLFGQKSERRIDIGSPGQMSLGEWPSEPAAPEAKGRPVVAHTRKAASRRNDDESVPFFDETRVPVEVIELSAPETDGLSPEDYEIISHKESYRLAQQPGSYVLIKYRRPVVKIRASQALVCAPAPSTVIDGSRADERSLRRQPAALSLAPAGSIGGANAAGLPITTPEETQ